MVLVGGEKRNHNDQKALEQFGISPNRRSSLHLKSENYANNSKTSIIPSQKIEEQNEEQLPLQPISTGRRNSEGVAQLAKLYGTESKRWIGGGLKKMKQLTSSPTLNGFGSFDQKLTLSSSSTSSINSTFSPRHKLSATSLKSIGNSNNNTHHIPSKSSSNLATLRGNNGASPPRFKTGIFNQSSPSRYVSKGATSVDLLTSEKKFSSNDDNDKDETDDDEEEEEDEDEDWVGDDIGDGFNNKRLIII